MSSDEDVEVVDDDVVYEGVGGDDVYRGEQDEVV